jgi:hypothetical protein
MAERPDITMTDDQVRSLLSRTGDVVVAAIGPDGWPLATLAPSQLTNEGVVVEVPAGNLLAPALTHGAAVCCVADEGVSYFEIKGVIARGQVARVEQEAGVRRVDVRIDHIVSFDFAKLPEASGS